MSDTQQTVRIAHPIPAGGKDRLPGQDVKVDAAEADRLVGAGLAQRVVHGKPEAPDTTLGSAPEPAAAEDTKARGRS